MTLKRIPPVRRRPWASGSVADVLKWKKESAERKRKAYEYRQNRRRLLKKNEK